MSAPPRAQSRTSRPRDHSAGSQAEQVLAHAQAGREMIQDFTSLADSLEWQLGGEYLRLRGNKAFLSDAAPVPFVVNNDGSLSRNAAEVFFASLETAAKDGTLEGEIVVLELGIGVGLFARYFLDAMRDLSRRHKKDYYDRLTYIAADRSERMLQDVLRHGVLADHPGRYRVRQLDAMQPEELGHGLRAVFLNYLLDCLPAAVLEFDGDAVRQLCVRTCVARNVRLADYTDLTAEQLRQRASRSRLPGGTSPVHSSAGAQLSRNAAGEQVPPGRRDPLAEPARDDLLEVYGLFASEYDYRPVDAATLPYGAFAVVHGRKWTKRLLHSYGAIACLEKLLGMLAPGGFILVNDHGQTHTTHDEQFEHQRFSLATFVGVNFALLKTYFGEGKRCQHLQPDGDDGRGIHSRLFAPAAAYETHVAFAERFSDAAHKRLTEPIEKARVCAKMGRFEMAADCYREAIRLQPRNWVLLCEVSQFLTFQFRDPKTAADSIGVGCRQA